MTAHDQQLIEQAKRLPWWAIHAEEAETKEGYDAITEIEIRKYHRDEFRNGTL